MIIGLAIREVSVWKKPSFCKRWLPSLRHLLCCRRQEDMLVYECDGHPLDKALPGAVVFPTTADRVAAMVKLAHRHAIPFVARGAGTGLSRGRWRSMAVLSLKCAA